MSFSKPVLVSNALAQKRLIEAIQGGRIHKEKDSVDFADKVIELYGDKDLRARLGENGKRFIEEEFCWEKVSANLCNLYKGFEKN
jgi:glycosyltransferase involved in cell wall biosynthesis